MIFQKEWLQALIDNGDEIDFMGVVGRVISNRPIHSASYLTRHKLVFTVDSKYYTVKYWIGDGTFEVQMPFEFITENEIDCEEISYEV